ncbi:MAG: hypothetical protein ACFFEV_08665, partial [Candidatus Thorarchaeota archaeon]
MRSMRLINKMFALFTVTLFVLSFSFACNSAAITQNFSDSSVETSYLDTPSPIDHSVPAAQGTNVDWYTDEGYDNFTSSWSNNNWMFGPKANYELFFNNGSQIDKLDYIPLGEPIIWRVNVPRNVIRDANLQSVYVNGWYNTPDMDFDANFNLDFYNGSPSTWSTYSYSYNSTSGYSAPPYVSINTPDCRFTSDLAAFYVIFNVTFTHQTPKGLYNPWVMVYDDLGNSYDVRRRGATDDMMFNQIAIGVPLSEAFAYTYHGGYTLEKQDLAGDVIHSVSRNTDFMMRLNITGNGDLAYAALWTQFSGDMQIPVNKTGQHTEMIPKMGGWEYDPVLETYFYNSSAEYFVPEMVWGEYTTYDHYMVNPEYRSVDYRYVMWNDTLGMNEIRTSDMSYEMRLMYIYNFTSMSWETIYGFTYWTYPLEVFQPDVFDEQVWYTEPIENAPFTIYDVNEGLSNVYSADGVISVEFIGHFTNDAPKGAIVNFQEEIVSTDGFYYGVSAGDMSNALMTWQEYNAAKEIAVESPVTIAKLLSVDDSPIYSWFFPANPGTPFEVQGRLQGGADLAADIDGALFEMKAYDSFWAEDLYGYTDMYYEILVDSDETVTLTAYNYTAMENKTWGYHWEWNQVLLTDWHWEYNESTGTDEWVYGEYYTYTDEWVEGWYHTWYYYNQRDNEWVSSDDWYNHNIKSELSITQYVPASLNPAGNDAD